MRLDVLFAHSADLGLGVEWANLGEARRGYYRKDKRLIVLHRGLTRAQATSTLAHEVGHHVLGHTCSTPRHERQAWEYGAALVINVKDYRRAERIAGHHPNAVAAELGVTPRLVEAWQDWYRRTRDR